MASAAVWNVGPSAATPVVLFGPALADKPVEHYEAVATNGKTNILNQFMQPQNSFSNFYLFYKETFRGSLDKHIKSLILT